MPPPPPDPAQQQYMQDMQNWQQAVQKAQGVQADNMKRYQDFMQAAQLIRAEALHAFSIDIETDSMKAIDEADDQMQRLNFLKTIFPMLQETMPMVQGGPPEMANMVKEMMMLGVRGFPIARSLEGAIEDAFDAMAGSPPSPPPSAQDDLIKAQSQAKESDSRIQVAQIQAATAQMKSQADMQMEQERLKGDQAEQAQNMQLRAADQASQNEFRRQRSEALQMRMIRGLGGPA